MSKARAPVGAAATVRRRLREEGPRSVHVLASRLYAHLFKGM